MANTINAALINDVYTALDVVSRELTGMIPGVTRDATAERAALNQNIDIPIAPAASAVDITPAATVPDRGDQTIGVAQMTISKSKAVPFRWNGEEELSLNAVNNGPGMLSIRQGQIAQAFRTLSNLVETDLCALSKTFSRAYGTAGTTPFATAGNFTDASLVSKILKDNGAPGVGNRLVLDTAAGANLIGFQSRTDIAGQDAMLRQGVLLDTAGFAIAESAQVVTPTKGTGTSYTSATTGYAIGTTSIPIITGSGTVLAGDVVTFTGDTNKYLVTTGVTEAGTIVIAAPGLRIALAASAVAMTIGTNGTQNLAFSPSAIVLAARQPALPDGGDIATDRMSITDARTGLTFELAMYPGYRTMLYEVGLAWGVSNIKPEHTAVLFG